MLARAKTLLLASLAASVLISWVSGYINAYYLDVIIGIGINIMLATSLNLINGITGQFSLGHAGFMAVGAYTSAVIFKHYYNPAWTPLLEAAIFLGVLLLGGIVAAISGLAVGIPTLRLAGDYLA